MPYARPTLNEIIDRIVTDMANRIEGANGSVLRRSLFGLLARSEGGTAHLLYGYIDWVAKQAIPDTADEEWLIRWARIWGIFRKLATSSTGNVAFTGNVGAQIAVGTLMQSQLGGQYRVTKTVTLTSTTGIVNVQAVTPGLDQDLQVGAKLSMMSPVPGIATVGTVASGGITGGTNIETIEALRARLLARIRNQPQGGSAADYEQWAKEVPGVTRAWVYPRQMGAGTVTVLAASDNSDTAPIPSQTIIDALQAHLDEEAPVTAVVYALAPRAQPMNPVIALSPNTPAVQAAVRAELEDLITREAKPGGTLLLSRIREAVSIAAGESDNKVISPSDNFTTSTGNLGYAGHHHLPGAELMAKSAQDYSSLLRQLFPPGRAISDDRDGNLQALLDAMAEEFARIDARASGLPQEVLPDSTAELLSDWERVAGLPDNCSGSLADTLQGRRNALVAKLAGVGGQSKAYFIALAASLGYQITIRTFKPFSAGLSRAGDPISNGDWVFTWMVEAPATTTIEFRAGLSAAGEPLRSWGNGPLECKINQLKPAHTNVIFSYGSAELEASIESMNRISYFMNYTLPQQVR